MSTVEFSTSLPGKVFSVLLAGSVPPEVSTRAARELADAWSATGTWLRDALDDLPGLRSAAGEALDRALRRRFEVLADAIAALRESTRVTASALRELAVLVEHTERSLLLAVTLFAQSVLSLMSTPFTAAFVPVRIAEGRLAIARLMARAHWSVHALVQPARLGLHEALQDFFVQLTQIGDGNRAGFDGGSLATSYAFGAAMGGVGGAAHLGGHRLAPDLADKSLFDGLVEGGSEVVVEVGAALVSGQGLDGAWTSLLGGVTTGTVEGAVERRFGDDGLGRLHQPDLGGLNDTGGLDDTGGLGDTGERGGTTARAGGDRVPDPGGAAGDESVPPDHDHVLARSDVDGGGASSGGAVVVGPPAAPDDGAGHRAGPWTRQGLKARADALVTLHAERGETSFRSGGFARQARLITGDTLGTTTGPHRGVERDLAVVLAHELHAGTDLPSVRALATDIARDLGLLPDQPRPVGHSAGAAVQQLRHGVTGRTGPPWTEDALRTRAAADRARWEAAEPAVRQAAHRRALEVVASALAPSAPAALRDDLVDVLAADAAGGGSYPRTARLAREIADDLGHGPTTPPTGTPLPELTVTARTGSLEPEQLRRVRELARDLRDEQLKRVERGYGDLSVTVTGPARALAQLDGVLRGHRLDVALEAREGGDVEVRVDRELRPRPDQASPERSGPEKSVPERSAPDQPALPGALLDTPTRDALERMRADRAASRVLDDEGWRHSPAETAPWFEPDRRPVPSAVIEELRGHVPAVRVLGEDRSVLDSSRVTRDGVRLGVVHGRIAYDTRSFEVGGVPVRDFTVRLHLDRPSAPVAAPGRDADDALRARVAAGVERLFNRGYRLPGGEQFHVTVEFVADPGDAHARIRVAPPGARADQLRWPVDIAGETAAHEVGHFLGLRDEYVERAEDRRAVFQRGKGHDRVVDDGGLMGRRRRGAERGLRPRHLWLVENTRRATGSNPTGSNPAGTAPTGAPPPSAPEDGITPVADPRSADRRGRVPGAEPAGTRASPADEAPPSTPAPLVVRSPLPGPTPHHPRAVRLLDPDGVDIGAAFLTGREADLVRSAFRNGAAKRFPPPADGTRRFFLVAHHDAGGFRVPGAVRAVGPRRFAELAALVGAFGPGTRPTVLSCGVTPAEAALLSASAADLGFGGVVETHPGETGLTATGEVRVAREGEPLPAEEGLVVLGAPAPVLMVHYTVGGAERARWADLHRRMAGEVTSPPTMTVFVHGRKGRYFVEGQWQDAAVLAAAVGPTLAAHDGHVPMPVRLVVDVVGATAADRAAAARFAHLLRGDGPYRHVEANTEPAPADPRTGQADLVDAVFHRVSVPRLEDVARAELHDAPGGHHGVVLTPDVENHDDYRAGAALLTDHSHRVVLLEGTDGSTEYRRAPWADHVVADRVRPFTVWLRGGADGFSVRLSDGRVDTLTPEEAAELVRQHVAAHERAGAAGTVRRPLVFLLDVGRGGAVVAERFKRAVDVVFPRHPYYLFTGEVVPTVLGTAGPRVPARRVGLLTLRSDAPILVEPGVRPQHLALGVRGNQFDLTAKEGGVAGVQAVVDAVLHGGAGREHWGDRPPLVVSWLSSRWHVTVPLTDGYRVQLGGREVGRHLLDRLRFAAALRDDPDLPVVLVGPGVGHRPHTGSGYDFASALRERRDFRDVHEFWVEPGGRPRHRLVSGWRAGDVDVEVLVNSEREAVAVLVRSSGDESQAARLRRWAHAFTGDRTRYFDRPDSSDGALPPSEGGPPVFLLVTRLAGGYAARSDGYEVVLDGRELAAVLHSDPRLREAAGDFENRPFVFAALNGPTPDLEAFIREMHVGGYGRRVHRPEGVPDFRPDGRVVLDAPGFTALPRVRRHPDDFVTHPLVDWSTGRVEGQFFPLDWKDVAVMPHSRNAERQNRPRYYYSQVPGPDLRLQEVPLPIEWLDSPVPPWYLDAHGTTSDIGAALRTPDPIGIGDAIALEPEEAGRVLTANRIYLSVPHPPGEQKVAAICLIGKERIAGAPVGAHLRAAFELAEGTAVRFWNATDTLLYRLSGYRIVEQSGVYEAAPSVRVVRR
ncbi:hypothetical protein ACIGNX_22325 [Actinosynnema sp. NPDC053489]|uniref:hypothetical protein n=1 Tax=Actinosynnema sp. NPDC053489 TaxID=3363916 RepID=UPI0037CB4820